MILSFRLVLGVQALQVLALVLFQTLFALERADVCDFVYL